MSTIPNEFVFQIQDLVLCVYAGYPVWPACINNSHQPRYKNQYTAILPHIDSRTPVPHFWVFFPDDDSGGWVPEDHIVRFHPQLVKLMASDDRGVVTESQKLALVLVSAIFDKRRAICSNPEADRAYREPSAVEACRLNYLINYANETFHPQAQVSMTDTEIYANFMIRLEAILQPGASKSTYTLVNEISDSSHRDYLRSFEWTILSDISHFPSLLERNNVASSTLLSNR